MSLEKDSCCTQLAGEQRIAQVGLAFRRHADQRARTTPNPFAHDSGHVKHPDYTHLRPVTFESDLDVQQGGDETTREGSEQNMTGSAVILLENTGSGQVC